MEDVARMTGLFLLAEALIGNNSILINGGFTRYSLNESEREPAAQPEDQPTDQSIDQQGDHPEAQSGV